MAAICIGGPSHGEVVDATDEVMAVTLGEAREPWPNGTYVYKRNELGFAGPRRWRVYVHEGYNLRLKEVFDLIKQKEVAPL